MNWNTGDLFSEMSKSEFGSTILQCEVTRMFGVRLRCFTKSTVYHILYLKWDSTAEQLPRAHIRISIQLDFLWLPFLNQNSKDWTSWGVSEDNNLYNNGRTNNVFINPSIRLIFFKSNPKNDSASFVFTAFTGIYYQNQITVILRQRKRITVCKYCK